MVANVSLRCTRVAENGLYNFIQFVQTYENTRIVVIRGGTLRSHASGGKGRSSENEDTVFPFYGERCDLRETSPEVEKGRSLRSKK